MRNALDGRGLRPLRSTAFHLQVRPGVLETVFMPHGQDHAIEFLVALAGSDSFCLMSAKSAVPGGGHMSLAEEVGSMGVRSIPHWIKKRNGLCSSLHWGKDALRGAAAWPWL